MSGGCLAFCSRIPPVNFRGSLPCAHRTGCSVPAAKSFLFGRQSLAPHFLITKNGLAQIFNIYSYGDIAIFL